MKRIHPDTDSTANSLNPPKKIKIVNEDQYSFSSNWDFFSKEIFRLINEKDFVCVNKDYVKERKQLYKIIFTSYAHYESIINGFILAFPIRDGIYIDVICAKKGHGGGLLDTFIDMCKTRNINVYLSSLVNVIGFYLKKGFRFLHKCGGKEIDYTYSLQKANFILELSRLNIEANEMKKKGLWNIENPLCHTVWNRILQLRKENHDFFTLLQRNEFNSNKKNCTVQNAEDWEINKCYEEGYLMVLCNEKKLY